MKKIKKKRPVNNFQIAVTSVSFSRSPTLKEELLKVFPNSTFNNHGQRLYGKNLVEFIKNADAAIVGVEIVDESILRHATKLKIISKYGVGLDNIDQEELKRRDIRLSWVDGVNCRSVSELTLCFMLGLSRNVFSSGFKLKQTNWDKDGGNQLSEKTVGIIGCGHIGSDIIKLLSPFKCKILVKDILDKSNFCREQGAIEASLEEIIKQSDVISLHVPLTDETRKICDERFLKKMKPSAFLINTSRGEVIDQKALKSILKQKLIAGAAIDVFTEEPPSDAEFLSLPNLMVTPHIGGNAKEAIEAMGLSAINNLVSFFRN